VTLTPGTRLGTYEIVGPIGAGGMGEVYRAHDTKLNRDVAIKVLPELFATDPDRLARFEREAQSLAALNHPNIAQVFGVIENPPALAMELVEGEDLSQRIARGAMPAEDALPVALQIADALEAAHERGIIHRDLKPANIKVRHDGAVKVLDFGLAKATDVGQGFSPADTGSPKGLDYERNSPTFTTPAMTQIGMILGTAAYMSPEQARGRVVDRRADIWAFGCVLFEMLTGKRPFGGDDVTETIASIVKDEPDWRLLPANLPPAVVSLLHRCLQKDARRRLRDIGDARVDIADVIEGRRALPADAAAAPARFVRSPWIAAAVVVAALAGGAATWLVMRDRTTGRTPESPVRFELTPPAPVIHVPNVALAPDASFVVYAGATESETSLFVHRFDTGAVAPVRGTSGAGWPFVSPDGKWVAFFRAGKIQKVSLAGGDALTLCDANGGPGAVWLSDGRIVFSDSWLAGLSAVSQDGGTPARLTTPDAARGEKGHWWPASLPDGRLLFTVFMAGAGLNDNRVAILDPASGRHQVLFAGVKASWLPSGHILFYRAGRYQVVPFDLSSGQASGDAVLVLDDATDLDPAGDWPQPVVVSATGGLAYVPGKYVPDSQLVWISDAGKLTPLGLPLRPYVAVALSPRGDQAAAGTLEGGRLMLRLVDLGRGTDSPLDLDGMNWDPVWHPDGRLSFNSMRTGDFDVFIKDVASSDREVAVIKDGMDTSPSVWTTDGRLVFQGSDPDGAYVLKLIDLRRPADVTRLSGARVERTASISPDGKWLALARAGEGRTEVFVQPFPGPGPAVRISSRGGENPYFHPSGRELYFNNRTQLVAVTWELREGRFVTTGERVVANVPWANTAFNPPFSVSRDGRILALVRAQEPTRPRIDVVLGWSGTLKRQ